MQKNSTREYLVSELNDRFKGNGNTNSVDAGYSVIGIRNTYYVRNCVQ